MNTHENNTARFLKKSQKISSIPFTCLIYLFIYFFKCLSLTCFWTTVLKLGRITMHFSHLSHVSHLSIQPSIHPFICCCRMGLVFSPGLIGLSILKLVIIMYIRSWAVMVTNVPPKRIFKASHQFYLFLLLVMLFVCLLAVLYTIVE